MLNIELSINNKIKKNFFKEISFFFYNENAIIESVERLNADEIKKILAILFEELKYLFFYCSFSFKNNDSNNWKQNEIIEYLNLVTNSFFFWEERETLLFFLKRKNFLENVNYCEKSRVISVCVIANELFLWKKHILKLKKKLSFIDLNVKFVLHSCKTSDYCNYNLLKEKTINSFFQLSSEEKEKQLFEKFSEKKLYELSVHTRFSTLDGIDKPKKFVCEAKKKIMKL